ncbi:hemolysin [Brevundimonas sp. SORGH_AS_0993]|uniref:hemolysin n=1 Tax=Brevundimonas sp. SORGH_AS_0993 TaxID=3041794 RepID=UPI0027D82ECB|nr:hemolysin [Brevundimonas sp. SORGH_AS_0993]
MKTTLSMLACAGALTLSACAPTQSIETPPGRETAYKICEVEDYQSYVGRNRSAAPAAPAGQIFRFLCTTCAATMDYRENRVNFVYDEGTGVIREVKCG